MLTYNKDSDVFVYRDLKNGEYYIYFAIGSTNVQGLMEKYGITTKMFQNKSEVLEYLTYLNKIGFSISDEIIKLLKEEN